MWNQWAHHLVRADGRRTLHVYCPPNEPSWPAWAKNLWLGRIADAVNVRRHQWGGTVDRVRMPDGQDYFYKRFSIQSWRHLHKPRRARATMSNDRRLAAAGFRVPQAACLIEKRTLGLITDSALVTRAVPDASRLAHLITQPPGDSTLTSARRTDLLGAFMREVARLHSAGFYHGDLHPHNVLYRTGEEGDTFFWMDNERGRAFPVLPERFRVDDLTQINKYPYAITRTDRMRLWNMYAREAGLQTSDQSRIRARVIAQSRRFWKKKGWL